MKKENEVAVYGANEVEVQAFTFADEGDKLIADLTTAKQSFCSVIANTQEEKAKLFNATNTCDGRISDMINKVIEVKDIYVEVVQCTNETTGEITNCPRVILIDKNFKSYQAVSLGIYSAIRKLIQAFGEPTWSTPVKLEVKQISKGEKKILTFEVVAK